MVLGCMHMGRGDQASADAAIEAALACGINHFDHAAGYSNGNSETLFGDWMQRHAAMRSRIVLQSKCGIRGVGDGNARCRRYDFSRDYVLNAVDGILARLRTDYLDILLFHRPDPLVDVDELAGTCGVLREQGKVRHFGVSNHSAAQMALMAHAFGEPPTVNQVKLSLSHVGLIDYEICVNRDENVALPDGGGTLEASRLQGITLQAWSPLERGYLDDRSLAECASDPYSGPELVERLTAVRAVIDRFAVARGVPAAAISLAWLLRHPARIQPVIGTGNPRRIADCARAAEVGLTREEWYELFGAARGRPLP
jgi:predicted oxidoreductase